jgi:hypothetical protein
MRNIPSELFISLLIAASLLFLLAACIGEESSPEATTNCHLIDEPANTGTWTTNVNEVYLSGTAFNTTCIGCEATPYGGGTMSWTNSSAHTSGTVDVGLAHCDSPSALFPIGSCAYPWNVTIPLINGQNEISINASDGCWQTISVTYTTP